MVREAGFSRIHVFSYSPRAGTSASLLKDDVPPQVKSARREALLEIERSGAKDYHRSLLGRVLDVLVEGPDPRRPGHVLGTSCRYAPVSFPGHAPALIRKRVPVRAIAAADGLLLGEPEPTAPELPAPGKMPVRRGRVPLPLL